MLLSRFVEEGVIYEKLYLGEERKEADSPVPCYITSAFSISCRMESGGKSSRRKSNAERYRTPLFV